MFKETTKPISDSLSNFTGGEKVASRVRDAHPRLRAPPHRTRACLEHTALNFSETRPRAPGARAGKASGTQTVRRVTGTQYHTDFSERAVPLRRRRQQHMGFAVTRGIARANYSTRATRFGVGCSTCALKFNNLSVGNPTSAATRVEPRPARRALFGGSGGGVFSACVFYKQITGFIYKRQFIYHGPATEFDG